MYESMTIRLEHRDRLIRLWENHFRLNNCTPYLNTVLHSIRFFVWHFQAKLNLVPFTTIKEFDFDIIRNVECTQNNLLK